MVAGVLTALAALLLTGRYFQEGAVLVSLTATQVLHEGDVFLLVGWAAGMLSLLGLLLLRGC